MRQEQRLVCWSRCKDFGFKARQLAAALYRASPRADHGMFCDNLYRAPNHDPASACRPTPTGQCHANLGAQGRDEDVIDTAVQPELTEHIVVLCGTPALQAACCHQRQQQGRERGREQHLKAIAAKFRLELTAPVTPLVMRKIVSMAPQPWVLWHRDDGSSPGLRGRARIPRKTASSFDDARITSNAPMRSKMPMPGILRASICANSTSDGRRFRACTKARMDAVRIPPGAAQGRDGRRPRSTAPLPQPTSRKRHAPPENILSLARPMMSSLRATNQKCSASIFESASKFFGSIPLMVSARSGANIGMPSLCATTCPHAEVIASRAARPFHGRRPALPRRTQDIAGLAWRCRSCGTFGKRAGRQRVHDSS